MADNGCTMPMLKRIPPFQRISGQSILCGNCMKARLMRALRIIVAGAHNNVSSRQRAVVRWVGFGAFSKFISARKHSALNSR